MSYILDALRRADAERQQGGVPGLHSPASLQPAAPTASSPWLPWAAAAMLLLALGAGLAWWWTRPATVVVVPVVAAPVTAPVAVSVPAPAPLPLPIVVSAAPAAPTPAPPSTPTQAAPPAPVQAAAQASAAAPKTVLLQQLPADQRRELPPLAVGGSVWSDNPGSRFVILDGQVVHEGDSVAPGLVLERIQAKAVLLRWRDLRLEIKL